MIRKHQVCTSYCEDLSVRLFLSSAVGGYLHSHLVDLEGSLYSKTYQMHWFLYLTSCNSFMTAYGSTLENFLNMCTEALSCVRVTDQRNDHWLRANSWSSVWITLHFTVPLFLNRLRFEARRYITCVLVKRHCIKFNGYREGFDLGICAFHTVNVNFREQFHAPERQIRTKCGSLVGGTVISLENERTLTLRRSSTPLAVVCGNKYTFDVIQCYEWVRR